MISYIFITFVVLSVIFGFANGSINDVAVSTAKSAGDAVTLCISLIGVICFWSGIMKIAQKSGITDLLSKILRPVLKILFKNLHKDKEAYDAVLMNVTSNILGLGNAATPFGIKAMSRLGKMSNGKATTDMIMFTIMNTASIQLIPTTIAAIRSANGSKAPFEILPAVWFSSILTFITGIIIIKIISRFVKDK